MKKIFNNSGMTFVEVIIAVIILGIISTPILMTLIQTSKLNLKSDVELKVNSKIQQVLEEVKAEGKVNPEYSTTGVYFDRFFESTTDPAQYTYKLVVADPATSTNKIDTTAEYDRWDFKLDLKKNAGDSTKTDVVLSSNTGVKRVEYAGVGNVLGGKLYKNNIIYSTSSLTPTNTFGMKFTGRLKDITSSSYANYRLNFGLLNFGSSQPGVDQVDFVPGYGAIDSTNNNTIIINITRNTDTSSFTFKIENLTFYTKRDDDDTVFQVDPRGNLGYTKHVVLNIFNDNPADQKVKVVTNSPYVDIFRKATPQIDLVNGQKIQVRVERVNPPAGVEPVVKTIESVVGKEVKVTP